ncbi:MAG: ATP-dependent Clp protease proteolytic subunit [Melioribacteraceae bacterium]|nr:ATP-dependent Clp protease proteolytic subunit [Melioribacteraceae bacterium]
MKKIFYLLFILFLSSNIYSQVIYIGDIVGDIDLGIAPYVKRVVKEAEENKAQAIIFRINTFGGRVDAATQIKDAILNSKVKTIAFIDKRAISAGALIALSCEKIIMVPGASMGASTVVDQEGKKQAEKYQSYMRSEMRATAEKNGRRTDIAQAMVDETIVIADLKDDSTKLVTLTAEEAVKYKMADTILASIQEVKDYFGFSYAETKTISSNWAEDVVRFLSNPIISSLLIMIGLVGLFTEIKTPGWGLAGTAGLIALSLFFGTSYILELATIWEIILFIIGVILLIVEIFVIPGFGIAGIMGIILMIAALFFGLITDIDIATTNAISVAIIQLASTFVLTGIIIYFLWKFLPKSQTFNKLILSENLNFKSGYAATPDIEKLVGKIGKSITDLRPAGSIVIDNERIDVVTEGDYIEKNVEVIVKKIEGSKVVVVKNN